jgi:hypothetical protein
MPPVARKATDDWAVARKGLRAPFTPAAVKWKLQTSPKEKQGGGFTKAQAVPYIDARLAADRLTEIVGGGWSTAYNQPLGPNAVVCRLTVLGVAREDVGTGEGGGDMGVKGMFSDALKRAAVQFGIGAFLYAVPKQWVDVAMLNRRDGRDGPKFYMTPAAEKMLRDGYAQWVTRPDVVKQFGAPIDHGDLVEEAPEAEAVEAPSLVVAGTRVDEEWIGLIREAFLHSTIDEPGLHEILTEVGVAKFPDLKVRIGALSIGAAEVVIARLEQAGPVGRQTPAQGQLDVPPPPPEAKTQTAIAGA